MEEYLQYMKTLRSQMNGSYLSLLKFYSELRWWINFIENLDVEDQAAKISVEEQMQITTIQSLEKDLDSGSILWSSAFHLVENVVNFLELYFKKLFMLLVVNLD